MDIAALGTFLKTSFSPMMRAFKITEPQHRAVTHGEDLESVLSRFHDVAFKPDTEIHFATLSVQGRQVTILALQEPAGSATKPA